MAKINPFKSSNPKASRHFRVDDSPENINYEDRPPIFSLKYMKYGGSCCLSKCEKSDRTLILDKLLGLSQFKWKDIHSKPKQGFGYESIHKDSFKKPFPPIVTPEVNILVFRYSSSGRIAGFRDKDIYHIVMTGPDLYSH